jgi:hypothetical protein
VNATQYPQGWTGRQDEGHVLNVPIDAKHTMFTSKSKPSLIIIKFTLLIPKGGTYLYGSEKQRLC